MDIITAKEKMSDLSMPEMLGLAHYIRYHFKQNLEELIEIYFQLDAWYGMAMAVHEFNLVFPEFITSQETSIKSKSALSHFTYRTGGV